MCWCANFAGEAGEDAEGAGAAGAHNRDDRAADYAGDGEVRTGG